MWLHENQKREIMCENSREVANNLRCAEEGKKLGVLEDEVLD